MRNDELHLHHLAVKLRGLRAWADGSLPAMGAVELLGEHNTLLEHLDRAGVIVQLGETTDGEPVFYLDFNQATPERLGGILSGSEEFCLAVARGLVMPGPSPIDLSQMARLDQRNRRVVLAALAVASGDVPLGQAIAAARTA